MDRIIITDTQGREKAFFSELCEADIDIGGENDFSLTIPVNVWNEHEMGFDSRFYIPGTEIGGIIQDYTVITKDRSIKATGDVFRGLLKNHIIEPPEGEAYLLVNGDANDIIKMLTADYDGLFAVEQNSGIQINNYQFSRYVSVLDGITKMLGDNGARLHIESSHNEDKYLKIKLGARKINDYSDTLIYGSDNRVNFKARDYRRGINHLICLGQGELEERLVLHLYVQKDGTIGKDKYYTGLSERTEVYEYSSVEDIEKLEESGRERLKKLLNYQKIEIVPDEVIAEIGDIVGGQEEITRISIKKPITRKIVKVSSGKQRITCKVGD